MSNENEWLKNLKAGDKVIRRSCGRDVVERITAATSRTVTVAGAYKFSRKDGAPWADNFFSRKLEKATRKRIREIEHWDRLRAIQLRFDGALSYHFTYDQLKRIAAIINEPKEKNEDVS